MSAKLLKGAEVAREIRAELKAEVQQMQEKHGVVPGLVTILVGENPASMSYVRGKQNTAHELGFYSIQDNQPADLSEDALLKLIEKYNRDPKIDGILVQLPLPEARKRKRGPSGDRSWKGCRCFSPGKRWKTDDRRAGLSSLHPAGIQELLVRSGTPIAGAEVVVIGRSNIVGKPIAMMLMQKAQGANATVTVCHTRTRDVKQHCLRADILIVAAGVTEYVKGDWVKPGAVVIDVGVNEVGKTAEGKRILKGDVAFDEAVERASAITPVPGGVGPMTITMLMKNTVRACKVHHGIN